MTQHDGQAPDSSGPQFTIEVRDPELGPLGWVVIDRVVAGTATGGVRMVPDVTPHELAQIARTMTFKYALLNISMGGAKGGITRTPAEIGISRPQLLERFGRAIAPLMRCSLYQPACDLGVDVDDFSMMMAGARCAPALPPIDTAAGTSITAFECIRAIAAYRRIPLRGLRVAVEGFGRVGGQLAQRLVNAGAHIMAVSTADGSLVGPSPLDVDRLIQLRAEHGSRLVRYYPGLSPRPHADLFVSKVDVLIPGARTEAVHIGNSSAIRAQIVMPVGNASVTVDAERALTARGVLVIPDFMANCGGVLSVDLVSQGFDVRDVHTMVEKVYGPLIEQLLTTSERLNRPVADVARNVAWRNHALLTQPQPRPSTLNRFRAMATEGALAGVWTRVAWRAHKAGWSSPLLRQPALLRSAAWRLGATARRLATLSP